MVIPGIKYSNLATKVITAGSQSKKFIEGIGSQAINEVQS